MPSQIKEKGAPFTIGIIGVILGIALSSPFIIFAGIIGILFGLFGGWDRWKCDYCDKKFPHKADCLEHEKNYRKIVWGCGFCSKRFKSAKECKRHERICKETYKKKTLWKRLIDSMDLNAKN